jgi:EAL domain-containing protein (putative c-di-GMP-specific phosphodiesterase class I)
MRDGIEPASQGRGIAEGGVAARSLALAAEELVRAGGGAFIEWEGARITTHFQPIYSVRTGICLGFEALARARDAAGVEVAAESLFEAVADSSRGLLDWACRALHLRNYATVDPGDRMLFINVHPEAAVRDARRAREFGELIRYYGLAPKRVCVEILEAQCSDDELLGDAVHAYRELGAAVAMDDFGVGCSDFERVRRLRPGVVKLDRSVIAACSSESARRVLRETIVQLRACGAKVAIEGVETRAHALDAIEAGADYLQGHFFAIPQSRLAGEVGGTEALDQLLQARRLAA